MKTLHCPLLGAYLVLTLAAQVAAADQPDQAAWAEVMAAARVTHLQSSEAEKAATRDALFQPYDSGPLDGQGPATQVVVDVSGLNELRLITKCERMPANCNIWGEPRLVAKDGSVTRLTALTPTSIQVGWGQMLVDRNWQDKPLQVGDRTFEFGLWVHADSELCFALDGRYERFEAQVGEDVDRAAGLVRFEVRGAAAPAPSVWADVASKFPTHAGWLRSDAGADGIAAWFGDRETARLEREILRTVLRQIQPADTPLHAEAEALAEAQAPAGDPRWLDLYARACRYRQCSSLLGSPSPLQSELDSLVALKVPDNDPRWSAFRARAVQVVERDDQFAALQFDIRQRAVLSQSTGERDWNGDRHVPAEASMAEEIAKQVFHPASLVLTEDRDPADIVVRRTAALLADLKRTPAATKLAAFDGPLAKLQQMVVETPMAEADARRKLFDEACQLRRQIAFSNPLLDFDELVFIKRHRAIFQHMCDQFYGICQNPGGGLFVLKNAFGEAPTVRDVLAGSICETGRLRGQHLVGGVVAPPGLQYDGVKTLSGGDAEGGSFLAPALSPDARQIAFAYVERKGSKEQEFHEDPTRGHWDPQRCYHLFKVNVDGSGLEQLTDGSWNDFDPCWLPNGRLAFISERRGGYLRCGRACPLYTLYDMNVDGSEINCLSFHDSNEWNPSVAHDGDIVWTRWDYVDRHGCIAHMPWTLTLDGRDPRPLHGNYAPRLSRPDMELFVRAIPGSSKYVGLATPHHGQAYGSIIIIHPQVADDDGMGPVRRFTPEVGFPESQGGGQAYSTPWPLSENYHLCVYDAGMSGAAIRRAGENYGIYLVDAFGNKELIYRDPDIGCMNPIPLRPTRLPAAAAPLLAAKPATIGDEGEATMAVVNVYDTHMSWPADTK
ncbi:MAG: NPCBM/NEW2 domain-containing protein, partial [Pirellulaceae bacterium]